MTKTKTVDARMKDVTPPKFDKKNSNLVIEPKAAAAKSKLPKPSAAAKKSGTAVALHKPSNQVVRPAEPKSFLQVIVEAAGDPRCDVAKMQALLDMQRQIEDRDAEKAFTRAFIELQGELPAIKRDGKIEVRKKDARGERTGDVQQATPYATFNAIMKTVGPLLVKHGFTLSFQTQPNEAAGRLLVTGLLTHSHGASRSSTFPLPIEDSGSKNNVQGWGSSLSYGKRYCTIALLNIVSESPEDRDTDGFPGDFGRTKDGTLAELPPKPVLASRAQLEELRNAIELNRVPEYKVLEHYGLDKLEGIEARFIGPAIKQCEDYAANLKANQRHG